MHSEALISNVGVVLTKSGEANVASVKLTLYRCPFNGCLTVSVCFNRRCCPEWLYNLIYLTHFTLATTVGASRVSVVFFLEHNVFFCVSSPFCRWINCLNKSLKMLNETMLAIQCCAKRNNSERKCQANLASWECERVSWKSKGTNQLELISHVNCRVTRRY